MWHSAQETWAWGELACWVERGPITEWQKLPQNAVDSVY